MKNTFFLLLGALFLSAGLNAQSTVDSINAKYKLLPMPEALTTEKAFPVLGMYQLNSTNEASTPVSITLDSLNKGLIWVAGLPQGTFKAYLKQSPSTYRIIAQKSATGTSIPEGTLIFDPSTSTLNIALGRAFNNENPAAIFPVSGIQATDLASGTEVKVKSKKGKLKTKSKLVFYTATKADQNTTATSNTTMQ